MLQNAVVLDKEAWLCIIIKEPGQSSSECLACLCRCPTGIGRKTPQMVSLHRNKCFAYHFKLSHRLWLEEEIVLTKGVDEWSISCDVGNSLFGAREGTGVGNPQRNAAVSSIGLHIFPSVVPLYTTNWKSLGWLIISLSPYFHICTFWNGRFQN